MKISKYVMIPSKGGCFELRVGDQLLYSKLKTGEFPDEDKLLRAVEKALGSTWSLMLGRKKRLTDYANCAG
jgi:predicted Rdx family selenoprotein